MAKRAKYVLRCYTYQLLGCVFWVYFVASSLDLGGAGKWVWVWVTHYWAGVFLSFSLGFGYGFGFWSGYIPLCYDITLLFTWLASQENLRLFMFSWLSIY